jgi:ribosomal protein L40E
MSWMSSTSRRLLYPAVVLAVAAAVGGYATWSGGRSSVAFLVAATLALGWVVWLSFRAAQALLKDGPVVDVGAAVTGKRRKELEREKQSLLKALKELDFDHEMGKVSDKDFADISATYRARAIRVMRRLDDAGRDYETMIAREVAERLRAPSAVSHQPSAAEPPAADREKCGKCGTRNDSDAEFCKKCGGKLVREAS